MNDERLIEDFNNIINELNKICKNNEQGTYFFDELRKKGHFKDRDLVKWNWPQEGATTVFSEMG